MHIYLMLAALVHVQSFWLTTGAPSTSPRLSSIAIRNNEAKRSSHNNLNLVPIIINENATALPQPPNIGSPSNQSNPTVTSPQNPIPYRVQGTSTSLLFHTFGANIPHSYMLQCLSFSLTLVLQATFDGRGRDPITNGVFFHKHLVSNGDNVTISVVDFREIGKPMNYDDLRDTLSGIGDFMTEPDRAVTTLSYEVDVDVKGYVGTGHVGFETAVNGA